MVGIYCQLGDYYGTLPGTKETPLIWGIDAYLPIHFID